MKLCYISESIFYIYNPHTRLLSVMCAYIFLLYRGRTLYIVLVNRVIRQTNARTLRDGAFLFMISHTLTRHTYTYTYTRTRTRIYTRTRTRTRTHVHVHVCTYTHVHVHVHVLVHVYTYTYARTHVHCIHVHVHVHAHVTLLDTPATWTHDLATVRVVPPSHVSDSPVSGGGRRGHTNHEGVCVLYFARVILYRGPGQDYQRHHTIPAHDYS